MTTFKSLGEREQTFVGGRWRAATGDRVLQIVDPSTEEVIASVRENSTADVAAAAQAARAAFDSGPWPDFEPAQRAAVLEAFAERVEARGDEIADTLVSEIGAPLTMARGSVRLATTFLRYYADLVRHYPFREDRLRQDGTTTRILREPTGPVAAIASYNSPFAVSVIKTAPALAAGCTIVLKPPPETPLAVHILGEIAAELTEAGVLPPGVLNVVVAGKEGSEALVADPAIDKITFTGSTQVGRAILATAGQRIGRVTVELGGKSAGIVLDDADLEQVVAPLVGGGTVNTGQACFGLTRVLVSERRRDELVDAMKARIETLVVGDPRDPATTTGPLAGARHLERVQGYVELARSEGARVVVGGGRPAHLAKGYFFEPTLLVDVDNSSRVAREEIFGPVISVITYRDLDEAVSLANDSIYGLGGAVFAADPERAFEVARRIRTGTVAVNGFVGSHVTTPFGGYKQSGMGKEGGVEGLEVFLEAKSVHMPT